MANWTDEEVVFYQTDGGVDRIKMIFDAFQAVYYPTEMTTYTNKKGDVNTISSAWMALLKKWGSDYPESHIGPTCSSPDWIGNILPAFDLHHWYEQGGKDTTMRSFVDSLDECGIYSDVKPGLKPHVRLTLRTAWAVVQELWDELAEKYDLEYVQMGIEESGVFAFNTDRENRYLVLRHIISYYDGSSEEFQEERWISSLDSLIAMFKDCLGLPEPLHALLPNAPGILNGNLVRSKTSLETLKEQLSVEEAVEAMNRYIETNASSQLPVQGFFSYQMLRYE